MSTIVKASGNRVDLIKGMVAGTGFDLEELVEEMTEYKGFLKPGLITNLLNPSIELLTDEIFRYDEDEVTAVLPSGKRYEDKGVLMGKNRSIQHMFRIPSSGLGYTVLARDIKNKRIPGKQEMMTFDYLTAREQTKAVDAYDLYNEYNLARVLTTDTMDNRGGGFTSPNFHTEIVGTARPAALRMDLINTTLDVYRGLIEDEQDRLAELAANNGRTISGWVMVCGRNYFNGVRQLEDHADLARPVLGRDLTQLGTPVLSEGSFDNIRFFEGSDNCHYTKYVASILGTRLIGDDDAYMIPTGVESLFYMAFAPSDDKEFINKEAQTMYMYREENKRGYSFELESNRFFGCKLPQLILPLSALA